MDIDALREIPLLSVSGMSKTFGPTRALHEASFLLRSGEIHALVGENGSGKSTLVKILSGVHQPDAGIISLGGRTVAPFRSPRRAQAAGISTVFQEVAVVEERTVMHNLWLGNDHDARDSRRRRGREVLAELMEQPPSLGAYMADLSLSDRQICNIARSLLRDPKVLILDEATSALDYESRTRLFAALTRRARAGVAVVLITHKMDEIEEIGDRITVMRSGETVATLARGEWSSKRLVSLMTGSDSLTASVRERRHRVAPDERAPVVLRTEGLRIVPGSVPIDVEIRTGEFIGLAGLEGHGHDEFLRALWGEPVAEGRVVRVGEDGAESAVTSPRAASREGIVYLPRDRRTESVFEALSILDNFALPTLGRDVRGGLISDRATRKRLEGFRDRLNIKMGGSGDEMRTLSGGNQQKVVLARLLAFEPRIVLLNDPTRGIDINAKRDLYAFLEELAAEGLTVVMLSTEVDEQVELMDRVLVFREQSVVREFTREELTRDALVSSYFGEEVAVP